MQELLTTSSSSDSRPKRRAGRFPEDKPPDKEAVRETLNATDVSIAILKSTYLRGLVFVQTGSGGRGHDMCEPWLIPFVNGHRSARNLIGTERSTKQIRPDAVDLNGL